MPTNPKLPAAVSALTLFTGATFPAGATGFDLPDQDAFAIGRGMAFVATADNPSAIYYNPAGLAFLPGHQVRGGVYGLYLHSTYDAPAGGNYDNDRETHAIPQLFYSYGLDQLPLSFGLGVYSPFGLSSRWPDETGFRTLATEGKLTSYTINPAAAWRVLPTLSLAAGLTVTKGDLDLARGLAWPTQPYDEFRFEGDGWSVGYNLGVLWRPIEKISLGATFRSENLVPLDGDTRFFNNVAIPGMLPVIPVQYRDASADFPLPCKVIVGLSYRPTPKWNLEFNADLTGWDRLGTVTLHQSAAFPPLLPQEIPLALEWESSWYYEFGATRYLEKGWFVSAGYIFNESSVPDAYYTPLVADQDRHFFSVGAGYSHKHVRLDLAYQFGYGPTHTVSGSTPSATGQTADGDYEFLSHALALTLQWAF
jgi:long-chain fatty acid transport protein